MARLSQLRVLHALATGLAVLLMSACQTPDAGRSDGLSVADRQQRLQALESFEVVGGLGIWTDEEAVNSRLAWRERGGRFELLLTPPLGVAPLIVKADPANRTASVQRGSGPIQQGRSAGALLQQSLGLSIPVPLEQFSSWLRGLPGDGSRVRYDPEGRLESLEYRDQSGTRWRASVLKYSKLDSIDVPGLITAQGGPYNVRLVLKTWSEPVQETPTSEPGSGRLSIPGR